MELHLRTADDALADSTEERPPILRRADMVTLSLGGLLLIAIGAVLYIARAFFLPLVTALVIGTMLAPAARWLERWRVPRAVAAALIVSATFAGIAVIVGLISAPLVEWTSRLPELGLLLHEKLRAFDRPIALWHQFEALFGIEPSGGSAIPLPRIEWVQPTLEFLSPTFTEILLFVAVLVLFIASWPDLRRALILNFRDHEARLRTLRILNAIETNLANYLLTVTLINMGVGIATGLVCIAARMPNPAGLGALAATLNFIPIIGPVVMFVVLGAVGVVSATTLAGGLVAAAGFAGIAFIEGHFVTPTIIGRRLALNALLVFVSLAFWTWLWGPMGAFLSSPLLIVGLILKEHLIPINDPRLPEE